MIRSPLRSRSAAAVLGLLLALSPAPTGAESSDGAALVVVLVDTSLSTLTPWDEYHRAWTQVLETARGGDRFVLALVEGRVAGTEASALRHVMDRELPRYNVLRDNPVTYEARMAAVRSELSRHYDKGLVAPRASETQLVRSIRDVSRFFVGERRRRKILVILSDLLEDSEYRFRGTSLTAAYVKEFVTRLREQQMLPHLTSVEVFTVMPGTTRPEKADELERFWIAFFTECGATMRQEYYGTLANFRR